MGRDFGPDRQTLIGEYPSSRHPLKVGNRLFVLGQETILGRWLSVQGFWGWLVSRLEGGSLTMGAS